MGSEYNNRKGTLYFYHNSLNLENCNIAVIFQITTTDEKVEAWNNVFAFSDNVQYPSMRANQEVDTGTTGGIVNLYKNWIVDTWADSDPYHPVSGQLNGIAQLVLGKGLPFDLTTFQPTKEELVDNAIETPSTLANMVSAYPVQYQLNESFIRLFGK